MAVSRRRHRPPTGRAKAERGKLPTVAEEQDIVVLFADVIGCSEISNHKTVVEYNKFINSFQDCFRRICEHYRAQEYKAHERPFFDYQARGDEGCLKIFVPDRGDWLPKDIDVAISIALELKRNWLLEKENQDRIENGLLPVDIGIGIHAGKVFVNEDEDNDNDKRSYRPEGYAINLAKRIESESRGGKFSHILVSESARGQLYSLKDESTYRFDMPFTISPKGISRDISVFELKHHFLPTDWLDSPSEVSMIHKSLDDDKLKIAERAYNINPTNLWLAEEYLFLIMVKANSEFGDEGKTPNANKLKAEYNKACEVAERIANTELRDAGLLGTWGFILGEQKNFAQEQRRYEEALALDEQDGDLHWYMALSISYELYDALKDKSRAAEFYAAHKDRIEESMEQFRRALELRRMNAWIVYDYACELSQWSQVETKFRKTAIDMLIKAFGLNEETKEKARDEEYLRPIIDDDQVKKYLES